MTRCRSESQRGEIAASRILVCFSTAIIVGACLGLGSYTFDYADGLPASEPADLRSGGYARSAETSGAGTKSIPFSVRPSPRAAVGPRSNSRPRRARVSTVP